MSTIGVDEIDRILANEKRGLRFAPALEAMFERQAVLDRVEMLKRTRVRILIIYNAFLLADFLLAPGTFWLATAIHLCVVSPIIFLITRSVKAKTSLAVCETLTAIMACSMIAQVLLIFALNKGDAIEQYQYLAILIFSYINTNQRLNFPYAVAASSFMSIAYGAILLSSAAPFPVKFVGITSMVAAVYLGLFGGYRVEMDRRMLFLRALREEIKLRQAEAAAAHDSLTGLCNRRQLETVMNDLWQDPVRRTSSVAIVMVDVDCFKLFNDTYGHSAGDVCLRRVGQALASQMSGSSEVAVRFGGEEFLLLLSAADLETAIEVAGKARQAVEDLAMPHAGSAFGIVTVSLGVAAAPPGVRSAADLIEDADAALYGAKRRGRNQVWPAEGLALTNAA